MQAHSAAGDDWELSKENIQPLKHGRKFALLSEALRDDHSALHIKENFELELRTTRIDDFDRWIEYLRWMEQCFPSGSGKHFRSALERCLKHFGTKKTSFDRINDPQWLYVWQKYADCSNSVGVLKIYEQMYQMGHCTLLSAFYIRWAEEYEQAENFQEASKIFQMGFNQKEMAAEEKELLETVHSEFELRVARRLASHSQSPADEVDETRNVLGVLRGVSITTKHKTHVQAPFIRHSAVQGAAMGQSMQGRSSVAGQQSHQFIPFREQISTADPASVSHLTAGNQIGGPAFSLVNEVEKENYRDPSQWPKEKLTQAHMKKSLRAASTSSSKRNFDVFVEEALAPPLQAFNPLQNLTNSPRRKDGSIHRPTASVKPQQQKQGEVNQMPGYCKEILIGEGGRELQFEEVRAKRWVELVKERQAKAEEEKQRSKKQAKVEMRKPFAHKTFECSEENFGQSQDHSGPGKQRPNSSSPTTTLTRIMTKEVMGDFYRSLELSHYPLAEDGRNSSANAHSDAGQEPIVPAAPPTFKVFTEEEIPKEKQNDEEDKENVPPPGFVAVKENRSVSGILTQASGIPCDPQNAPGVWQAYQDVPEPINSYGVQAVVQPSKPTDVEEAMPRKRSNSFEFDPFEPTLARLDKPSADGERLVSTPNMSRAAPLPSFSVISKKWANPTLNLDSMDDEFELDCNQSKRNIDPSEGKENMKFAQEQRPIVPNSADSCSTQITETSGQINDCMFPASIYTRPTQLTESFLPSDGVMVQDIKQEICSMPGRRLSTIVETSREYKSSSSSSSDASSRRHMNSTTQSHPLAVISEQWALTPGQTGSDWSANRSTVTAGGNSVISNCTSAFTPYGPGAVRKQQQYIQSASGNESQGDSFLASAGNAALAEASFHIPDNADTDENVERTGYGATQMLMTSKINPFDPETQSRLLLHSRKRLDSYPNFHAFFDDRLPPIVVGKVVDFSGEQYKVLSLIGEGAFARAYRCVSPDEMPSNENVLCLKVQKPSCPWEFYVCEEAKRRIRLLKDASLAAVVDSQDSGIMIIRDSYFFANGSVIVNQYHQYKTVLDLINLYSKTRMPISESIAVYFLTEIFRIVEALHASRMIHADVKPDNFLVKKCPPTISSMEDIGAHLFEGPVQCLKLIDFGRCIDMAVLPPGATFIASAQTEDFVSPEMKEGREWNYQADYFGVIATIHCIIFQQYMVYYKTAAGSLNKITKSFKRSWNVPLWKQLFDSFLNIPSCGQLPNMNAMRRKFEDHFLDLVRNDLEEWNFSVMEMQQLIEAKLQDDKP